MESFAGGFDRVERGVESLFCGFSGRKDLKAKPEREGESVDNSYLFREIFRGLTRRVDDGR